MSGHLGNKTKRKAALFSLAGGVRGIVWCGAWCCAASGRETVWNNRGTAWNTTPDTTPLGGEGRRRAIAPRKSQRGAVDTHLCQHRGVGGSE